MYVLAVNIYCGSSLYLVYGFVLCLLEKSIEPSVFVYDICRGKKGQHLMTCLWTPARASLRAAGYVTKTI